MRESAALSVAGSRPHLTGTVGTTTSRCRGNAPRDLGRDVNHTKVAGWRRIPRTLDGRWSLIIKARFITYTARDVMKPRLVHKVSVCRMTG